MEQNTPPVYEPMVPGPAEPPRKSRTWMIIVAAVLGVLLLFGGTCAYVGVKVSKFIQSPAMQSSVAFGQVVGALMAGAYDQVWTEASPTFQKATPRDKFVARMTEIDTTYGKAVRWQAVNVTPTTSAGANDQATIRSITFLVTHERGDVQMGITLDEQGRLLDLKIATGK